MDCHWCALSLPHTQARCIHSSTAVNTADCTHLAECQLALLIGPPQGLELPSGRLLVAADHIGKGGVWGSHSMFSDDGAAPCNRILFD